MAYEKTLVEYTEIAGLRWVRNVDVPSGPNSSILLGGRVTTAVIRKGGVNTEYAVWGIHLATNDELTFVRKDDDKPIVVKFVDCRRGSATIGRYFEIETSPDSGKRLVIPRGVAHLPINCNGLITLNTPSLFWDYRSKVRLGGLELDVVNVEKDRDPAKFPTYDVCRFPVPDMLYPAAIRVFKNRYNPKYQAPFVFDRNGQMFVLRKKVQNLEPVG